MSTTEIWVLSKGSGNKSPIQWHESDRRLRIKPNENGEYVVQGAIEKGELSLSKAAHERIPCKEKSCWNTFLNSFLSFLAFFVSCFNNFTFKEVKVLSPIGEIEAKIVLVSSRYLGGLKEDRDDVL